MDTNFSVNFNIVLEPSRPNAECEQFITINHPELKLVASQYQDKTAFLGVATNRLFNSRLVPECYLDLLLRAYSNRTRERNYFRLYCQLLDNEITDDEFDAEIDENPDKYVVKAPMKVNIGDVYCALNLSERMMDIDSTDDFASVFSIDDDSISNYVRVISNE